MTSPGHILIIDDDPELVAIYRDMFEKQGLQVTVAHTADDGTRSLEQLGAELDVVLLDQKLQGRGGPEFGLELMARTQRLAPFAKTIVVTGYATAEAIERAFQLGVYDYLVKNGGFSALIRAKVRNAIEVTSERRLAALSRERVVSELRSTWGAVRTESDRNRKGKLLEELIKLLFRATPSSPPSISALGPASSSHRGFTTEFHEARREHARDGFLVIPVDREDLEQWIEADDRALALRNLHKRAVFGITR